MSIEKDSGIEKTFSVKELSAIFKLLQEADVAEFHLERGGEKLSVKRSGAFAVEHAKTYQSVQHVISPMQSYAPQVVQSHASDAVPSNSNIPEPAALQVAPQAAPAVKSNLIEIKSPMVGTFYRRPAVDADPYVNVGDAVKKGQVLCIVEAMKLMNEIEAEISGRIVEVCLDDAQMVEYGEVMFRVEPI